MKNLRKIVFLPASIIGTVAYMGMTYMGLDAIRALFNMSGLPGLIIAIGACAAFVKVIMMVKTEAGQPVLEPAPAQDGQK